MRKNVKIGTKEKRENMEKKYVTPYDLEGKLPLKQAIPLGLQHVLAMFVGNLTPLIQIFAIGPVGAKLPIVMGTSSGFIGVCNSVAVGLGGGTYAYGAIMGASLLGGLFEVCLDFA